MSQELYFVISNLNGDTHIRPYHKLDLLAMLKRDEMVEEEIFKEFPHNSDPAYWKGCSLIIKGNVVKVTPPGDWRIE
jgi:hypothetical protein